MNNDNYILVTGGAGFIGSHVCKELHSQGFIPVVIDNLSTGHQKFVKWGPFHEGDLLDISQVRQVFHEFEFKGVMHFAAKAYVGESVRDPLLYFRQNIQGTMNLLEVCREAEISAFVFSSSCATYGEPNVNSISENCPQNPINPYGFSKLACEKLITYLGATENFNYSILRYFNAAGADIDLEIGELHKNETHLIPLLLKAGRSGESFKIFGTDFNTPDGSAIRDFIHVKDLASAHVLALKHILNFKENLVCNLGTGIGTSVIEVLNAVKNLYPELKFDVQSRRIGDPAYLVADNSFAREVLGWNPNHSSIENIIQSADLWESACKKPNQ